MAHRQQRRITDTHFYCVYRMHGVVPMSCTDALGLACPSNELEPGTGAESRPPHRGLPRSELAPHSAASRSMRPRALPIRRARPGGYYHTAGSRAVAIPPISRPMLPLASRWAVSVRSRGVGTVAGVKPSAATPSWPLDGVDASGVSTGWCWTPPMPHDRL